MSFLRRLVPALPGGDDDSDGGEGEALLEHEDYSSSESESSSSHDEARLNEGESGLRYVEKLVHVATPCNGI